MHALDSIRTLMGMGTAFTDALLSDLADAPFARVTPDSGQHAYWILGHLVVSESAVLDQYLLGQPSRAARWVPQFGIGTVPADDPGDGPGYDELLDALRRNRADLVAYVDTLDVADLDRRCHPNDWPGPSFDSVGECLNAICLHMGIHGGQLTCARRALGRSPLRF